MSPPVVTFDAVDDTAFLSTRIEDDDGAVLDGVTVEWTSSNPAVATVSASGVVVSAGNGTATITAEAGSVSGSATVSVEQSATQIEAVSGDGQTGVAGDPLAQPLVVRALDRKGNPAPGAPVTFLVEEGGGSVSVVEINAGPNATAATVWTLGTGAGTPQEVRSFLSQRVGEGVEFQATAMAGPAFAIPAVSGDQQASPRLLPLQDPLRVRVVDRFGNPVAGAAVDFAVTQGGGSVSPARAITDALGTASTIWTLGAPLGEQRVTATVAGLPPRTFTATASVLPQQMVLLQGDGQTGVVGATLPLAPSVRVLGEGGTPVFPVDVKFTASPGNVLTPEGGSGGGATLTVRTDANGVAEVGEWTLGTVPGSHTVTAQVPGLPTLTLSAQALTGPPALIVKQSGDAQVGVRETALAAPLVVQVTDTYGNPVQSITVTFQPNAGHGSVAPGQATTNASGVASTTWTLGQPLGLQFVTASIAAGASVTFQGRATGAGGSGLSIEIRFLSTFTTSQQAAFTAAAERWREAIPGRLEPLRIDVSGGSCGSASPAIHETVADLLILVTADSIDGLGGTLASAGVCVSRHPNGLPALGRLRVDTRDLGPTEGNGQLEALITHEVGHVLGFGTIWVQRGLLKNPSLPDNRGVDTYFSGVNAIAAFDEVGGLGYPSQKVPVENTEGGSGTRDSHWRESVLGRELMTGFLQRTSNPLSRVTLASLLDLGYEVDESTADAFTLGAAPPMAPGVEPPLAVGDDVERLPIYLIDAQGRIRDVVQP